LLFQQIRNCLPSQGDHVIFIWCTIIGQPITISNQRTSSQLCFIATDDMTLSNEQQNAIAAVLVVQTLTSKTAKELIYLKPVEYVPQI
jgi:hypothetical protein